MDELHLDFAERIAKLEAQSEAALRESAAMKIGMDEVYAEFKTVNESLGELREELARYRGFWGGALLVCSAVWAFLQFGWEWIVAKAKGEA